jgi:hypothetical protein
MPSYPLDKSWGADLFTRKNYSDTLEDWQLRTIDVRSRIGASPFAKTIDSHCQPVDQTGSIKQVPTNLKKTKNSKKKYRSHSSSSDSSSSDNIVININLKKSSLMSKKSGKKVKNINIYTNDIVAPESEVDEIPKVLKVEKPEVKEPEINKKSTEPQQQVLEPPKDPVQIQKPVTSENTMPTEMNASDLFKEINFGAKLATNIKSLVIKPKPAKTTETLDRKLYDLGVLLSNKKETQDVKQEAIRKLESENTKRLFKIMLTDKGREEKLPSIHDILTQYKQDAIKLYMVDDESKLIVGGLLWTDEAKLAELNREIFDVKQLDASSAEGEKEFTKSLSSCRKAKELDI